MYRADNRRAQSRGILWLSAPFHGPVPQGDGLIDRPREKPWGVGEPSAAIVPAAISNAAFDAVGARLRSVPFTAEKVKAAIEGA